MADLDSQKDLKQRKRPPAQLPEDVGMWLDKLRRDFPAVDEVWILGQFEASAGQAVWQLLLFADRSTLEALRKSSPSRDDVQLAVVTDGDRFETVWGDPNPGRLSDSERRLESATRVR